VPWNCAGGGYAWTSVARDLALGGRNSTFRGRNLMLELWFYRSFCMNTLRCMHSLTCKLRYGGRYMRNLSFISCYRKRYMTDLTSKLW
jgi:hypothetical protein